MAIVTTGAGILLYVFVVQPTWDGTRGSGRGAVIAMLYPLFGLAPSRCAADWSSAGPPGSRPSGSAAAVLLTASPPTSPRRC